MRSEAHQANLNYSETPVKYAFLQHLKDILEKPRFYKQQLPRYLQSRQA